MFNEFNRYGSTRSCTHALMCILLIQQHYPSASSARCAASLGLSNVFDERVVLPLAVLLDHDIAKLVCYFVH